MPHKNADNPLPPRWPDVPLTFVSVPSRLQRPISERQQAIKSSNNATHANYATPSAASRRTVAEESDVVKAALV